MQVSLRLIPPIPIMFEILIDITIYLIFIIEIVWETLIIFFDEDHHEIETLAIMSTKKTCLLAKPQDWSSFVRTRATSNRVWDLVTRTCSNNLTVWRSQSNLDLRYRPTHFSSTRISTRLSRSVRTHTKAYLSSLNGNRMPSRISSHISRRLLPQEMLSIFRSWTRTHGIYSELSSRD